jgi:hypothetical protein
MVVIFGSLSWLIFRVSDDVRTTGRWLIRSDKYKAEILAQPNPANGELKHAEWDGWGFAGSGDTVVYLVFDPDESLATAAKSHSPGNLMAYPVQFLTSDVWRTAGTQCCSTRTLIGTTVVEVPIA